MYNLEKVVVAGALFVFGVIIHTEGEPIKEDEKRDTTFVRHIATKPTLFVLSMLGGATAVGWILGANAFSGPWTTGEILSALLAFGALALRRWAVITLQHYFTFTVGLRKDHK
jgi:hypothetical protein